jgi:hypothetical protein
MRLSLRLWAILVLIAATLVPLHPAGAEPASASANALQESASQSLQQLFYLLDKDIPEADITAALQGVKSPELSDLQNTATGFGIHLKLRQLTPSTLPSVVPAIVRLRNPDQYVLLAATGRGGVLVESGAPAAVMSLPALQQRLEGNPISTLTLQGASAYHVADAVRIVQPLVSGKAFEESVELSNAGAKPLSYQVEATSCGCTTADHNQQTLDPAHSRALKFQINEAPSAERLVVATVHTSDPVQPRALLGLRIAPARVRANPESLSLRGDAGHPLTGTVSVTAPKAFRLQKIATGNPLISAKVTGQTTTGEQVTYQVAVSTAPTLPAGAFRDAIKVGFRHTKGELSVPIEGYADGDIKASPNLVVLDGPAPLSREVAVYSPIGQSFSIKAIHCDDPAITAQTMLNHAATRHKVVLQIQSKVQGALQSRVTLLLSDGRELSIDVLGQAR